MNKLTFPLLSVLALSACARHHREHEFAGSGNSSISQSVSGAGADLRIGAGPLAGTRLQIPAGALAETKTITVQPDAGPVDPRATAVGPCGLFGPGGTAFNPGATLTMPYDPSKLPAGSAETDLRIHRFDTSGTVTVLPTTVDAVNKVATATIPGFSKYQVMLPVPGLTAYLPKDHGNRWEFENGGVLTTTLAVEARLAQMELLKVSYSRDECCDELYFDDESDDGLVLRGVQHARATVALLAVLAQAYSFYGRIVDFDRPVTGGSDFRVFDGSTFLFPGTGSSTVTILRAAALRVGNREFGDVIEMRMVFDFTTGPSETRETTLWLARDFGPVQVQRGNRPPALVRRAVVGGVEQQL